jgi:hypothetical protein
LREAEKADNKTDNTKDNQTACPFFVRNRSVKVEQGDVHTRKDTQHQGDFDDDAVINCQDGHSLVFVGAYGC